MKILSFDPSGNFQEGNGTTGWALFEDGQLVEFGETGAKDATTVEEYWNLVGTAIRHYSPDTVVCESYRLYGGTRGKSQINSSLETPQLIGYLRMICFHKGIRYVEQAPSLKTRVADPILTREGVFEKKGNKLHCLGRSTNLHMRDAIRHGIYYLRYGKEK